MNKGFIDWLKRESPDVICLQEIKANKEQVEISEIENLGYNTFWFSAQKKGYSGVAIFSKQKPNHVEYGSGICLLYTSPSPRDLSTSRMPSSA